MHVTGVTCDELVAPDASGQGDRGALLALLAYRYLNEPIHTIRVQPLWDSKPPDSRKCALASEVSLSNLRSANNGFRAALRRSKVAAQREAPSVLAPSVKALLNSTFKTLEASAISNAVAAQKTMSDLYRNSTPILD